MAARNLPGMRSPTTGKPFAAPTSAGPRWTGEVEVISSKLDDPLRWEKPSRVFVNSMSDLFHEGLSDIDIAAVFGVMADARRHTFQVLTKRPARMLAWFSSEGARNCEVNSRDVAESLEEWTFEWSLPNVWLGVSVEDQATADERIPLLLQTPAAVRFVSYEPALGPVDFAGNELALDWIIVGGESGPGARPFRLEWMRSAVRQCREAGVAAFCKQVGSRPIVNDIGCSQGCGDDVALELRDRKGGDPSEWPAGDWPREFPA
jgi:protein gp37